MSNIWFITGAAGFIGSNLCCQILKQGGCVIGYDNLSTGTLDNLTRIKTIGKSNFNFIQGDIRDLSKVDGVIPKNSHLVHLAAQVSVPRSMDFPAETNLINVTGFLDTYLAAGDAGVKSFIYASSCAVYGNNSNLPLVETEEAVPLSPYAVSKFVNEKYAEVLADRFIKMRTVGLRFFNVFGPWQNFESGYASVIPKWLNMIINGHQPIIFGDGAQTRDFCYISDVCEAIIQTASNKDCNPKGVYNVCSGTATNLNVLYEKIVEACFVSDVFPQCKGPVYQPARIGDIVSSVGDPLLIEKEAGFSATVDLNSGIRNILKEQYGK